MQVLGSSSGELVDMPGLEAQRVPVLRPQLCPEEAPLAGVEHLAAWSSPTCALTESSASCSSPLLAVQPVQWTGPVPARQPKGDSLALVPC